METHQANRIAVGDRAKQVRLALKNLGMLRCSLRQVYYQTEPCDLRLNWYEAFWRWFSALWAARRDGAEYLFVDFCARVDELCGGWDTKFDIAEQLARCESKHSAIVSAFLRREDAARIRRALIESIVESRRLLAHVTQMESLSGPEHCSDRAPPVAGSRQNMGAHVATRMGRLGHAAIETSPSDVASAREASVED